ncbi:GGDEF domain-containing protein [Actinoplanes sp. NPDC051851]|uniref:GGDEF domain-containing protein n=1 Tax=Actinoplanes sp. NPDC051851 TaxID=3154753 RepID=UPI003412E48D
MTARLVPVLRAAVVALALGVFAVRLAGLPGGWPDWLPDAATCAVHGVVVLLMALRVARVRAQRLAWSAFTLSVCTYVSAQAYAWAHGPGAPMVLPGLSWADIGWLAYYPLAFAGLLCLLYDRAPTGQALLDGATSGLGAAAVFSAFVIDGLIGAGAVGEIVGLAYPVADALLVGTLSAQLALGGWSGATSTLIMGGFTLTAAADTAYTVIDAGPSGTGLIDVLYLLGIVAIGLAAGQPQRPVRDDVDRNSLRVAILFAVGALVVLLVASRERMSLITVSLAGLTLVAVVLRVVTTFRDMEAAGRLRHLEARRDALTGLANRRAVLERLETLRQRPDREPVALLLLDLDRFKQVNDVYGHQAGDDLLHQVALRLGEAAGDGVLVGRLGGDEFVMVADGAPAGPESVAALARRVRERLCDGYRLTGPDGTIGASIDVSIGIAIRDDADPGGLLRDADIAMYQAKRAGGGHVLFDLAS